MLPIAHQHLGHLHMKRSGSKDTPAQHKKQKDRLYQGACACIAFANQHSSDLLHNQHMLA
jgi:hypothetical protein